MKITVLEQCAKGLINIDKVEGKAISTAFVESLINSLISKRFCKKQQMQWSKKRAHLLMQIRTAVVNDELDKFFQSWYPNFHNNKGINDENILKLVA